MKRRAFHFFAALSLLLSVATVALWVWSYRTGPEFYWLRTSWFGPIPKGHQPNVSENGLISDNLHYDLWVGHGGVLFQYHRDWFDDSVERTDEWEHKLVWIDGDPVPDLGIGLWHTVAGFGAFIRWETKAEHLVVLELPLWFFVVVFAILAGWPISRKLRRHKAATCAICGYDLRGTRERCPECGTARLAG